MAGVTDDVKNTKFYKGEFIDVNPLHKLKNNPNFFDYIDKKNSKFPSAAIFFLK